MNSIIAFACLLCLASVASAQKATANQFPYHVGLSLNEGFGFRWCSGSIISNEYILTSAGCLKNANVASITIGDTTHTGANLVKVQYTKFYLHPNYNQITDANDIALIKIPAVQFTDAIQPVTLPKSDSYLDDQTVTSTGWGFTSGSNPTYKDLMFANFQVVPNSVCSATYGTNKINSQTLCASTSDKTAACYGDFGGPLVLANSKIQIGVSSFGGTRGCGKGSPEVYTKVASHLDWIKKTAGI